MKTKDATKNSLKFAKFQKILNKEKELHKLSYKTKESKEFFFSIEESFIVSKQIFLFHLFLILFIYLSPYLLIGEINQHFTSQVNHLNDRWGGLTDYTIITSISVNNPLSYSSSVEEIFFKMRGFNFADKAINYYQNLISIFYLGFLLFIMNSVTKLKTFYKSSFEGLFCLNLILTIFIFIFVLIRIFILYTVDSFVLYDFLETTEILTVISLIFLAFMFFFYKKQRFNVCGDKFNFKFKKKDFEKLYDDIEKINEEKNTIFNEIFDDKKELNLILNEAKQKDLSRKKLNHYHEFIKMYNDSKDKKRISDFLVSNFEKDLIKNNKKTMKIIQN